MFKFIMDAALIVVNHKLFRIEIKFITWVWGTPRLWSAI